MKIALVGNQNSGKTSLFNLLTGSNQKIGNWPGVTIEQKSGKLKGTNFDIVDLPGIYSLSPYSPEEAVSRKYIFKEKPDLIINIIDATSIERNLYLTTMLLELDTNVIIALNMTDMLEKKGITINVEKLSKKLNTTIIPISALKREGIDELIETIKEQKYIPNSHIHIYPNDIEETLTKITEHVHMPHERFSAIKMLENDPEIGASHIREIEGFRENIERSYNMDIEEVIADKRYDYIVELKNEVCTYKPVKESLTKRIDKIILNRWAAIPIFIAIMALIYFLAIYLGGKLTTLISDALIGNESIPGLSGIIGDAMKNGGASPWSISLMQNGIINPIGSIISFVPQIVFLFVFIALLEGVGYMSRIAYFFDKVFHKFGLSGKSLIPFIVGTGCSVPGIMSTRIVEDDSEKKITIATTPLMPCSAKLPIISLFASFIVGSGNEGYAFLIAFLTYIVAILLILIYSFIIKKIKFKNDSNTFLSELPEYKVPSYKYVIKDVTDKTWEFIKRAGTVVLVSSIIIWWLSHYSWGSVNFLPDNEMNKSMLANIGSVFGWFFIPMMGGQHIEQSWALAVASMQGLIAKEQVVSSISVIGLNNFTIFNEFPVVAVAFLAFVLYSIPCIATVNATRRETGSWIKTLKICLFQLFTAWAFSSLIGGIGVAIVLGVH